ncbi:hypothetical protein Q7M76_01045 [Candidatus Liberibacter asiaticus]|uniref:Uncharacterized protein n=2 Tax=Liberibacter asiaticus TaxID=34021 RepID=C6XHR9_LIBAP|nr:hypothetical protein [Candidatus Liberibacter asiaticus]ACT56812.1 hypothetical protein CLIBASIA_01120 [Candidatus Liberibacter asiaticus str. psy62]AGH16579.1 hypothetical protein WSI_01035 [Candidatus Liberibacter asiaticus str. gxpsy]ALK06970.1 hypothetical protein CD16_01050 [Candidatus Liberibacter asiaticus]ASK52440.1 hypothetical protein B2I23_01075 [Candidatus Liberibacter asiaticus]AWL13767.1 hypothetical protein DIC79_01085 [Candidatus Liberibacter asiaticus]
MIKSTKDSNLKEAITNNRVEIANIRADMSGTSMKIQSEINNMSWKILTTMIGCSSAMLGTINQVLVLNVPTANSLQNWFLLSTNLSEC